MNRNTRVLLYAMSALLLGAHGAVAQSANRERDIKDVLAVEKTFSKMSVDTFPQAAFDRYLSADAMIFRPRATRAISLKATKPLPAVLTMAWQPIFVDVSRAGDFAYTTGPLVTGARRGNSDPTFNQYVHVWRKQKDGRWLAAIHADVRVPADVTNPDRVAMPEGAAPYTGKASPQDQRSSLLDADNAFGVAIRTADYSTAIKAAGLADMRMIRSQLDPTIGLEEVVKSTRNARVTMWMPVEASAALSGDLGYTRGSYVIALPSGGTQAGDYVRVWRREKNGSWKIALDMLSPGR